MKRLALLIPLVILLVGCGGKSDTSGASNTTEGTTTMDCVIGGDKSKAELANLDESTTHEIVVDTNKGSFKFELATKTSPCTTASIAGLVQKGFFDGLTFHRIVPGFVIQGGDPAGNGSGGPGYSTVDAPPKDTQYVKGLVAMAKAGNEPAGTSGSQFFVVTGANVGLPPDYAVLGRVTEGLGVVEKIGALGDPNNPNGTPTERVEIKTMKLETR
ncbi:MAG TPA: peptidylprolyl isomerase [Gaiellaceae bacterium]|nr:peptidylprolyl isomerase [Gaiellaceae bacterium]